MPALSGLEATKRLSDLGSSCKILLFTMHESGRLEMEARECGAQGYVLKAQAARDLIRAIDFLLAGSTFFGAPPELQKKAEEKNNPGLTFCLGFSFA
jgi:DNA-binding NarL/FixJ family response regulator